MKKRVKIMFNIGEECETMWAIELGNDTYMIDNSPFFVYGLSWKDVVEAFPGADGRLLFNRIIKKSGHRTIRIASEGDDINEDYLKKLKSLGCSLESANNKYVVVDIPKNVLFESVQRYISESNYTWEYADPKYSDICSN